MPLPLTSTNTAILEMVALPCHRLRRSTTRRWAVPSTGRGGSTELTAVGTLQKVCTWAASAGPSLPVLEHSGASTELLHGRGLGTSHHAAGIGHGRTFVRAGLRLQKPGSPASGPGTRTALSGGACGPLFLTDPLFTDRRVRAAQICWVQLQFS